MSKDREVELAPSGGQVMEGLISSEAQNLNQSWSVCVCCPGRGDPKQGKKKKWKG